MALETDPLTTIADKTGIDLATITRWFSPNATKSRRSPRHRSLLKLAEAYGIQPWQVMKIIEERILEK